MLNLSLSHCFERVFGKVERQHTQTPFIINILFYDGRDLKWLIKECSAKQDK
jgi:hypothetical protein